MEDELGNIYSLYQSARPIADLQEEKAHKILRDLALVSTRIISRIHLFETSTVHHTGPSIINRYQKALNILDRNIWEEVNNINTTKEKDHNFKEHFLKEFSTELLKLRRVMRQFFPDDFDGLYPSTHLELESEAGHLNKKLTQLSAEASSEKENELLSILKTTITPIYLESIKAGFFHIEFLSEMLKGLRAVNNTPGNKAERWMNLMIEYGFNSPMFYSYCCIEIIKKRDDCPDIIESYRELYWIKKRLQQLVPWTNMPFHSTLPGIKSSLMNFVDAEISHLQSLEKIAGDLAGNDQINENFKVSFSVKELAYFIHLQVECGIILEEKPKKIHQYVIAHYSTQETKSISEKSFKNASYSRSENNVSKVITKLSEMIARAQDDL